MLLRRSSLSFLSSAALLLALLVLLLELTTPASAATPTSFCKCTCFKKSYIIALDAPSSRDSLPGSAGSSSSSSDTSPNTKPGSEDDLGARMLAATRAEGGGESEGEDTDDKEKEKEPYKAKTCNDCNRQFCVALDLPICKGATDEDVKTSCFQRDSSKDEAVVFIFIIATVSLLGWALLRPFVSKWMEQAKERRSYMPISNEGDQP